MLTHEINGIIITTNLQTYLSSFIINEMNDEINDQVSLVI